MGKFKSNKKNGFNIPGMKNMRCPYCSSSVHLRSADGIYKENSQNAQLYVCSKYPTCDSYVRVQPGTRIPVGSLANAELRSLRVATHRQFDKLHVTGIMTKRDAYGWLAFTLQTPLSQAHIGYMGEYHCNLIIEESRQLLKKYSWKLGCNVRPKATGGGGCRVATQ
jgi:hypothetical protein